VEGLTVTTLSLVDIDHIIEFLEKAQQELDTIYAYCYERHQFVQQTHHQYLQGEMTQEASQAAWKLTIHTFILACTLEAAVYQNLQRHLDMTHVFDE
jgi:hypothetical protein